MTDLNAANASSTPQDNDKAQNIDVPEQAAPNSLETEAAPAATPQAETESQAQADPQQAPAPQAEVAPQQATEAPAAVAPQQAAEVQAAVIPQAEAVPPQTFPAAPQPYGTAPQPYGTVPQPYGTIPQQPGATADQAAAHYAQQAYTPQGYYYPNQAAGTQAGGPYAAGGPGWPAGSGMAGYPNYPYGAYPPPSQQEKPKKRRVWPWVLLAVLVVLILGVGGCVSCMAFTVLSGLDSYESSYYYDYSSWEDRYDYDDYYSTITYTYDELLSIGEGLANHIEDGAASGGVYRIGSGLDLEPGEYFFEGSETEEGFYYHFEPSGSEDSYVLAESIVYFGNYYAELAEGDVIIFIPSSDAYYMMLSENASFNPTAPYRSGLYLVGTDIPAGTYIATCDTEAASNASNEAAVFIMQDLMWEDDSITDTYYVRTGGSHTIVLEEGMWVEAYAAILTPVSSEAYDQEQEALG